MSTDKESTGEAKNKNVIYITHVCVEAPKTKFPVPPSKASDGNELLLSDSTLESIRELERGDGIHYASLGELWGDLGS